MNAGEESSLEMRVGVSDLPAPVPRRARRALSGSFEICGRYRLVECLGTGGMAEVFRAIAESHGGFQRVVVIKRLLPEIEAVPHFVEMFVEEARVSAMLHHPNVVQVTDFGMAGGRHFLAMEYLRGHDLRDVARALSVRKLRMAPKIAALVCHRVARALDYAHNLRGADGAPLGLVHRDVSPSNVMLLAEGGVKLLDFGFAKVSDAARKVTTQDGMVKGKVAYVAPERLEGLPYDARADVFSLGVILWEMLTGARLFKGATDWATIENVLTGPIAVPSVVRPGIPEALDAIALAALERDPTRRYPSARAMVEALEAFLLANRPRSDAIPGLLDALFSSGDRSGAGPPPIPRH